MKKEDKYGENHGNQKVFTHKRKKLSLQGALLTKFLMTILKKHENLRYIIRVAWILENLLSEMALITILLK